MLDNITMKTKMLLLSIIITFSFIIISWIESKSISALDKLTELSNNVSSLEINLLELRKDEKDFLGRNDLKYFEKFTKNISDIHKIENTLVSGFDNFGLEKNEINNFTKTIDKYSDIFNKVVEIKKEIGLTEEEGLYGSLRKSVHSVQEYAKKSNVTIYYQLFMI